MAVYERTTLPNGLRVLSAPMDHAQSVTVMVMLAAGSRYETGRRRPDRPLRRAHVLQGTERRPTARDIAHGDRLESAAEFNAFTRKG